MKGSVRRIDTPHGRVYAYGKGPDAILMPSVTTILSAEPSPYLDKLEKELGKEKLKEIGERAAFRGTAMHKFLENYFICKQHGGSDEKCLLYTQKKTLIDLRAEGIAEDRIKYGRDLFYNFIFEGVFDQIKKVLFTEKFLWSLKYLFAGTTDFLFSNQLDEAVVADFKSASGHREEDVLKKYKKQLGAYAIAYEEINNTPVKNAQVWISSPDGMQIASVGGEELDFIQNEFIESCKRFHKDWNVEPFRQFYIENYVKLK